MLRERIAHEPHTVLHYQCSPYHLNSPLYPIIEQLELAAGFARDDDAEQKLDKLEAAACGQRGADGRGRTAVRGAALVARRALSAARSSRRGSKGKDAGSVGEAVEASARQQPLLIVFEDVHWVDPTSQEALDCWLPRLQEHVRAAGADLPSRVPATAGPTSRHVSVTATLTGSPGARGASW